MTVYAPNPAAPASISIGHIQNAAHGQRQRGQRGRGQGRQDAEQQPLVHLVGEPAYGHLQQHIAGYEGAEGVGCGAQIQAHIEAVYWQQGYERHIKDAEGHHRQRQHRLARHKARHGAAGRAPRHRHRHRPR